MKKTKFCWILNSDYLYSRRLGWIEGRVRALAFHGSSPSDFTALFNKWSALSCILSQEWQMQIGISAAYFFSLQAVVSYLLVKNGFVLVIVFSL